MLIDAIQFICIAVVAWYAFDGWKRGNAIATLITSTMEDSETKENEK